MASSITVGRYTIEKHGTSRFFAVRDSAGLVVVATYRKGAISLAQRLTDLENRNTDGDVRKDG